MTVALGIALFLVPAGAIGASLLSRWMRRAALGQHIRPEGPVLHERKAGTPTMGGAVILPLWGLSALLLAVTGNLPREGLFVLVCGFSCGAIGLVDDLLSQRRKRSLGLSPLLKVAIGSGVALFLALTFLDVVRQPLLLPFSSLALTLSPLAAISLAWAALLVTMNALNLTDGLDGLASGVALLSLGGLLALSPASATVVLPLMGALGGFLWVNAHPARLFVGNVGAYALGGAIAGAAVAGGRTLFLPLVAGVPALETLSVVLQVASFRLCGRRIFKISPLHHHFEHAEGVDYPFLLPSWEVAEQKLTVRLWIVQGVLVGFALLATRL